LAIRCVLTYKKLAWRAVVGELLWFLEGSTDERRLAEITFEKPREELIGKTTIWTANADKQGKALGYTNTDTIKELGPIYGFQWRNFDAFEAVIGLDQIRWLIKEIITNPDSRRLILSAWNPNQIHEMALPPCHTLAQFRIINGNLSCQLYQRSADMFLGVPFNIASYALLTHILAQICGLVVGDFVHTIGDAHIYHNHLEQVAEQIKRVPQPLPAIDMPTFQSMEEVLETKPSDYKLIDYDPMPTIKAPMAI
jgi:thymidylate synthase